MSNKHSGSVGDLVVRPSVEQDGLFLQALYHSARPDLQWIDGEQEFVNMVIDQQQHVQEQGIGNNFPGAMHYVVEKLGTPIGALVTDFGHNEIRVLYLAFIPAARGKGHGRTVLKGVQQAAEQIRCPVATVVWANNPHARQHYLALGFQTEERDVAAERMVWYPQQRNIIV